MNQKYENTFFSLCWSWLSFSILWCSIPAGQEENTFFQKLCRFLDIVKKYPSKLNVATPSHDKILVQKKILQFIYLPIKCSIPALTCSQGWAALLEPLPAIIVRRHVASSWQGHIERQRQTTNHTHTLEFPISFTFIASYLLTWLIMSAEAVCRPCRDPTISQGKHGNSRRKGSSTGHWTHNLLAVREPPSTLKSMSNPLKCEEQDVWRVVCFWWTIPLRLWIWI